MRILRNSRGFTLIELMLVLGLVALIFAIAVSPFKKSYARTSVQGAALRIASELQAMRDRAIKMEEYAGIVVLQTTNSTYSYATFEVPNTTDGTVPAGVTTVSGGSDVLSSSTYIIQRVALNTEFGGTGFHTLTYASRVVFNPGGEASRYSGSDGAATGDNTITFTIWNGDQAIEKTVTLNAHSGNVQVQ